jgi:hypothetical protein
MTKRIARPAPPPPPPSANEFFEVDSVFDLYGTFDAKWADAALTVSDADRETGRKHLVRSLVENIGHRLGYRPGRTGLHHDKWLTPLKDMFYVCPPAKRANFQRLINFYYVNGNLTSCDPGDKDHLSLGRVHAMTVKLRDAVHVVNDHLRDKPGVRLPKPDAAVFQRHAFATINKPTIAQAKQFASREVNRANFLADIAAGRVVLKQTPWLEYSRESNLDCWRYEATGGVAPS